MFFIPSFLKNLVNRVGRYLRVDEPIMAFTRPSYARVCMEVDISQLLPNRIWVDTGLVDGIKTGYWQKIVYELNITYCHHCSLQGHDISKCFRYNTNLPRPSKKTVAEQGQIASWNTQDDVHLEKPYSPKNGTNQLVSVDANDTLDKPAKKIWRPLRKKSQENQFFVKEISPTVENGYQPNTEIINQSNNLQPSNEDVTKGGNDLGTQDLPGAHASISTPGTTIPPLNHDNYILVPRSHETNVQFVNLGNKPFGNKFSKDDSAVFHKEGPKFITHHALSDIDIHQQDYNNSLSFQAVKDDLVFSHKLIMKKFDLKSKKNLKSVIPLQGKTRSQLGGSYPQPRHNSNG